MRRYLHELANWPNLTYQPAAVQNALLRAVRRQGEMVGSVRALGFYENASEALAVTHSVLVEDAMYTSAIEGEVLNRDAVRASVAWQLGVETGFAPNKDRHIDGLVELLIDATGKRRDEDMTEERLLGWQAALFPSSFSGNHKIVVGAWRDAAIDVVSGRGKNLHVHFSGPDAAEVPHEMARFLDWFNAPAEPGELLLKSALAHLWFVTIHPFADGNGRLARAVSDLLVSRSDNLPGRFYSLSSQIARERGDYYMALEQAQTGTLDVTAWIEWYLGCLCRALQSAEGFVAHAARKAAFWRRWSYVRLNERQSKMVNCLLSNEWKGELTAKQWSGATGASRATALRDINELVARRILMEICGGRSARYQLSAAD